MFERLKNEFLKMLQDTLETQKRAPMGSFPNDDALNMHRGITKSLEGCIAAYKQLAETIENENKAQEGSAVMDSGQPTITDAEIVS
jgi:hypothetical protein